MATRGFFAASSDTGLRSNPERHSGENRRDCKYWEAGLGENEFAVHSIPPKESAGQENKASRGDDN